MGGGMGDGGLWRGLRGLRGVGFEGFGGWGWGL